MRVMGTILLAMALAVPAVAQSAPPTLSPPPLCAVYGTLSGYVPARATAGSITVRVVRATPGVAFAVGSTVTFRVTAATSVRPLQPGKGATGSVHIVGCPVYKTVTVLQTMPVSSIVTDRVNTIPVSTI